MPRQACLNAPVTDMPRGLNHMTTMCTNAPAMPKKPVMSKSGTCESQPIKANALPSPEGK